MQVYLETFRNSVTKFLYDDRDRVALQNYISEYTNIDFFHWAIMSITTGIVSVHISLNQADYIMNNISYFYRWGQRRELFFENIANELH